MNKKVPKQSEKEINRIHKRGHKRIDTVYRAIQKDNEEQPTPYVEPYRIHLKNDGPVAQ